MSMIVPKRTGLASAVGAGTSAVILLVRQLAGPGSADVPCPGTLFSVLVGPAASSSK
jgi:hypothetical protein